jgi:threonine dehydratase
MITRADVDDAARRIAGLTRLTPVLQADLFPGEVWFKCEFMQHTGTFKARGALNRILASKERGELDSTAGVVVASGGNAGLANAYAAAQLGVPATVFVPAAAPAVKVRKLEAIGATVIQGGAEYAEAYQSAVEHAQRAGAVTATPMISPRSPPAPERWGLNCWNRSPGWTPCWWQWAAAD